MLILHVPDQVWVFIMCLSSIIHNTFFNSPLLIFDVSCLICIHLNKLSLGIFNSVILVEFPFIKSCPVKILCIMLILTKLIKIIFSRVLNRIHLIHKSLSFLDLVYFLKGSFFIQCQFCNSSLHLCMLIHHLFIFNNCLHHFGVVILT